MRKDNPVNVFGNHIFRRCPGGSARRNDLNTSAADLPVAAALRESQFRLHGGDRVRVIDRPIATYAARTLVICGSGFQPVPSANLMRATEGPIRPVTPAAEGYSSAAHTLRGIFQLSIRPAAEISTLRAASAVNIRRRPALTARHATTPHHRFSRRLQHCGDRLHR